MCLGRRPVLDPVRQALELLNHQVRQAVKLLTHQVGKALELLNHQVRKALKLLTHQVEQALELLTHTGMTLHDLKRAIGLGLSTASFSSSFMP